MIHKKFIKPISFLLLITFLHTFVLRDFLVAMIDNSDINKIQSVISKMDSFVLPYRLGRIVDVYKGSSPDLFVIIQDLHCHPEVQKNIYEIIKLLDSRYKVEKIFAEGIPVGEFNPKFFNLFLSEKLKTSLLNKMIGCGILSAVEFYKIAHDSKKVYGIEDWNVYIENYTRLRNLLKKKDERESFVERLSEKVKNLFNIYVSKEAKKFYKLINIIDNNKFYSNIKTISKKYDISLDFFPEIKKYSDLLKISKELNLRRVASELKAYYTELQKVVPYAVYSKLQQNC